MNHPDRLRQLMIDFFELPAHTDSASLVQTQVPGWDSFAMVHLVNELQATFAIEFDISEIDQLTSYDSIKQALDRKGVGIQPRV